MTTRRTRLMAAVAVIAVLLTLVLLQSVRSAPRAAAATITLKPVADTTVNAGSPTSTAGTSKVVTVDGSPVMQTVLRFDLASVSGSVQDAQLRLHVGRAKDAGSPAGGAVATSSNTTWAESTTSWNTRPAITGPVLATTGAISKNTWVQSGVTAGVSAGSLVTFVITSSNADAEVYDSRETSSTAPLLVVTTVPVSTTSSSTTTSTSTSTSTTTTTTTTTLPPPITGPVVAAVGDAVCTP